MSALGLLQGTWFMSEQEFFTVHHAMKANVEPLATNFHFPTMDELEAETPAPFVVASEFSRLDPLQESAKTELKNSELAPCHRAFRHTKRQAQFVTWLYAIAARRP
ncbi:hypothetical protein JCM19233_1106 [Vibrio astriarenae]|nr:hypothetical protein JCM19233_1106 [Vibrio sp. C7]